MASLQQFCLDFLKFLSLGGQGGGLTGGGRHMNGLSTMAGI